MSRTKIAQEYAEIRELLDSPALTSTAVREIAWCESEQELRDTLERIGIMAAPAVVERLADLLGVD